MTVKSNFSAESTSPVNTVMAIVVGGGRRVPCGHLFAGRRIRIVLRRRPAIPRARKLDGGGWRKLIADAIDVLAGFGEKMPSVFGRLPCRFVRCRFFGCRLSVF